MVKASFYGVRDKLQMYLEACYKVFIRKTTLHFTRQTQHQLQGFPPIAADHDYFLFFFCFYFSCTKIVPVKFSREFQSSLVWTMSHEDVITISSTGGFRYFCFRYARRADKAGWTLGSAAQRENYAPIFERIGVFNPHGWKGLFKLQLLFWCGSRNEFLFQWHLGDHQKAYYPSKQKGLWINRRQNSEVFSYLFGPFRSEKCSQEFKFALP